MRNMLKTRQFGACNLTYALPVQQHIMILYIWSSFVHNIDNIMVSRFPSMVAPGYK